MAEPNEIDPQRPETWPASAREYLARHRPTGSAGPLSEALREAIRATGPIPFVRFMERALYDPEHGYYAEAGRVGRAGDFVTAPTLHPAFGALLCRRIAQMWERLGCPDPFIVAEAGGGTGELAGQILRAAGTLPFPDAAPTRGEAKLRPFAAALRYRLIEPFPAGRAEQSERLAAWPERVVWYGSLEEQPGPPHLLLANELLDALPVHRVVRRATGLRELYVTLDERAELVEQEGPLTTTELERYFSRLRVEPPLDTPVEVSLAAPEWLKRALAVTSGGWVWLLDYGAEARDLYSAPRAGTLRAFHRHALRTDWLTRVGAQDLTTDVDFTTLIEAARAQGWVVEEWTTQRELLLSLGWRDYLRLRRAPATKLPAPSDPHPGHWALLQLIDPRGLGAIRSLLLRDQRTLCG